MRIKIDGINYAHMGAHCEVDEVTIILPNEQTITVTQDRIVFDNDGRVNITETDSHFTYFKG